MKPHLTSITTTLALAGAVVFHSGCATAGYEKAESAADSMAATAAQIETARRQLVEATTSLDVLINRTPPDLPQAFERYRTAVSALDGTFQQVRSNAQRMAEKGEEYFSTWDARLTEIHSEDIRERSLERQQEVTQRFTDIQRSYREAARQFEPVMTRLADIQKLLSVDLTPAGVQGAREFAERAEDSATTLRRTLDDLAERFREVSGRMGPGATTG